MSTKKDLTPMFSKLYIIYNLSIMGKEFWYHRAPGVVAFPVKEQGAERCAPPELSQDKADGISPQVNSPGRESSRATRGCGLPPGGKDLCPRALTTMGG
jgi:hypothetical protein